MAALPGSLYFGVSSPGFPAMMHRETSGHPKVPNMPIYTPKSVLRDASDGAGNPCGPYEALLFSDAGGLTQFGAFVEILPPGSKSSIKHWHETEDEMVYVLAGEATLHEGDSITRMAPGEAATFKAGDPVGHCFENASATDLHLLVIGTRAKSDTVTYPDNDCILRYDRETDQRGWTTFEGTPRGTPYTV